MGALALAGCGSSPKPTAAQSAAARTCADRLGTLGVVNLNDIADTTVARFERMASSLDATAQALAGQDSFPGRAATIRDMRAVARSARAFVREERVGSARVRQSYIRIAEHLGALGQTARLHRVGACGVAFSS